jgi:DNA-binding HxlR family transcriptional regulator
MKLEFNGRKINPTDDCPIRPLLCRLGNKWSLLVLLALITNGTMRFNDIYKLIGIISQRMLTVTLRSLEADGVVSRVTYPEVPPRTEYSITKSGEALVQILNNLMEWYNSGKSQTYST